MLRTRVNSQYFSRSGSVAGAGFYFRPLLPLAFRGVPCAGFFFGVFAFPVSAQGTGPATERVRGLSDVFTNTHRFTTINKQRWYPSKLCIRPN